jgi:glyoxylase-like metal-dependent hydrolase (beta-lactamase superfamily II)
MKQLYLTGARGLKRLPGAALSAACVLCATLVTAQPPTDFSAVEIEILHVKGNVYALFGAGGNTTVQAGPAGVLVVDTQYAGMSEKLLAAIRELSDQPIRYVINTHAHGDHIGGNEALIAAGTTVTGGNVTRAIADAREGAKAIAHENVLLSLVGQESAPPVSAWPTDTYVEGPRELYFNGEAIQLIYQPDAHTNGDSLVYFRGSDVISTGDLFVTTSYPVIDLSRGGTLNGIIDALNDIIAIAIPRDRQEGGTMIVSGHGRIADEADVVEYRDMLTIIRDRIQFMIDEGLSLEAVKEARPTIDYDPRYGSDSGFWTTDRFIDAAYQSLANDS